MLNIDKSGIWLRASPKKLFITAIIKLIDSIWKLRPNFSFISSLYAFLISFHYMHFRLFNLQILEALNKGEIPSTGSLVEVFNKGILERCLKLYIERMAKLVLPLPEQSLQEAHEKSRDGAMKSFDEQHFGRHHAKKSIMQLDEDIQEVYCLSIINNIYCSQVKLMSWLYSFRFLVSYLCSWKSL